MIVAIDLENKKNMLLLFDCTEKKKVTKQSIEIPSFLLVFLKIPDQ